MTFAPVRSWAQDTFAVGLTSLAQVNAELEEDEQRSFATVLAGLSPSEQHAYFQLSDSQPVGDRGVLVRLVLRQQPTIQRSLMHFFGALNSQQSDDLARAMAARSPVKWEALPILVTAVDLDRAIAVVFAPHDADDAAEGSATPPEQLDGPAADFYARWSKSVHRVIRYQRAAADAAPWQAQLFRAGASAAAFRTPKQQAWDRGTLGSVAPDWQHNHVCGAVYLGARWVLTAAHCLEGWDDREEAFFAGRLVRLGSISISDGGEIWKIDAVVRHGNYTTARLGNDIALLHLADAPSGRATGPLKPVVPAGSGPPPRVSQPLRLTGWGYQGATNDTSTARDEANRIQHFAQFLGVATLKLRAKSECNDNPNFKKNGLYVGEGQICAGSDEGADSCKGDSGGPLVWLKPGAPELVGLVSYGPGCGQAKTPGAYTDVRYYAGWIAGAKTRYQLNKIITWLPRAGKIPEQCRQNGRLIPCDASPK